VDGINLLAYRYDGDVPELVRGVAAATSLPLICAGSVDSVERIGALRDLGVWAFTVGTAALDGVFVPGKGLEDQLRAVVGAAA
jgi:phosphoribosylformimino-5-aminoimidazole carboxamide ribonucleotide (ProFAR) isomerase